MKNIFRVISLVLALSLTQSSVNALPQEKGDTSMSKILVVYAGKYGSTAGVAEAIGKSLRESGGVVDVMDVKKAKDLREYKAAVIGSGIYMGKWKGAAIGFLKKNKGVLEKMPVALFEVCLQVREDTPENRRKADEFLTPARKYVKPVDSMAFAGALDYSKLGSLMRYFLKKANVPEGDFRDWKAIDAWGKKIYPLLDGK